MTFYGIFVILYIYRVVSW